MSNTVNLNRNDLAKISPDLRTIKAFEKLFKAAPSIPKNEQILKGLKVLTWLSM